MNIWCFETAQFRVTVDAEPCPELDLSWDEDGSVRARLVDGSLVAFDAHATCMHKPTGICGDSYLGGCIYKDETDFKDNVGIRALSRREGRNYGSYFSDMVHECIVECRGLIAEARHVQLRLRAA